MKVTVDPDLFEANAICTGICPEIFRLEEDDMLTLLTSDVPERMRESVEQAATRCPRQALNIEG